ncbi:YciI family protein [Streptomyces sp. NPDC005574]|uniref:YciI family protein n=1 Tax=Streptomyces sp. NPDC005574 TaxID=3156891 RepID=UPI0033A5AAE7
MAIRGSQRLVTDGPFAEAREQLGRFFVLECADWAAHCPSAGHGTVEVRPVMPT